MSLNFPLATADFDKVTFTTNYKKRRKPLMKRLQSVDQFPIFDRPLPDRQKQKAILNNSNETSDKYSERHNNEACYVSNNIEISPIFENETAPDKLIRNQENDQNSNTSDHNIIPLKHKKRNKNKIIDRNDADFNEDVFKHSKSNQKKGEHFLYSPSFDKIKFNPDCNYASKKTHEKDIDSHLNNAQMHSSSNEIHVSAKNYKTKQASYTHSFSSDTNAVCNESQENSSSKDESRKIHNLSYFIENHTLDKLSKESKIKQNVNKNNKFSAEMDVEFDNAEVNSNNTVTKHRKKHKKDKDNFNPIRFSTPNNPNFYFQEYEFERNVDKNPIYSTETSSCFEKSAINTNKNKDNNLNVSYITNTLTKKQKMNFELEDAVFNNPKIDYEKNKNREINFNVVETCATVDEPVVISGYKHKEKNKEKTLKTTEICNISECFEKSSNNKHRIKHKKGKKKIFSPSELKNYDSQKHEESNIETYTKECILLNEPGISSCYKNEKKDKNLIPKLNKHRSKRHKKADTETHTFRKDMVFTEINSENKHKKKHKKRNSISKLNEYESKEHEDINVQTHTLEEYKLSDECEINSSNKHEENINRHFNAAETSIFDCVSGSVKEGEKNANTEKTRFNFIFEKPKVIPKSKHKKNKEGLKKDLMINIEKNMNKIKERDFNLPELNICESWNPQKANIQRGSVKEGEKNANTQKTRSNFIFEKPKVIPESKHKKKHKKNKDGLKKDLMINIEKNINKIKERDFNLPELNICESWNPQEANLQTQSAETNIPDCIVGSVKEDKTKASTQKSSCSHIIFDEPNVLSELKVKKKHKKNKNSFDKKGYLNQSKLNMCESENSSPKDISTHTLEECVLFDELEINSGNKHRQKHKKNTNNQFTVLEVTAHDCSRGSVNEDMTKTSTNKNPLHATNNIVFTESDINSGYKCKHKKRAKTNWGENYPELTNSDIPSKKRKKKKHRKEIYSHITEKNVELGEHEMISVDINPERESCMNAIEAFDKQACTVNVNEKRLEEEKLPSKKKKKGKKRKRNDLSIDEVYANGDLEFKFNERQTNRKKLFTSDAIDKCTSHNKKHKKDKDKKLNYVLPCNSELNVLCGDVVKHPVSTAINNAFETCGGNKHAREKKIACNEKNYLNIHEVQEEDYPEFSENQKNLKISEIASCLKDSHNTSVVSNNVDDNFDFSEDVNKSNELHFSPVTCPRNEEESQHLSVDTNNDIDLSESNSVHDDSHTPMEKCRESAVLNTSYSNESNDNNPSQDSDTENSSDEHNSITFEEALDYKEDSVDFEIPSLHRYEKVCSLKQKEKEQLHASGVSIKGGKYTIAEDNIIKRNFEDFAKKYGISDPVKLLGIGRYNQDPYFLKFLKAKHFYARLGKDLNDRALSSVYRRARVILDPYRNANKLTKGEVSRLKKLHKTVTNWYQIGKILGKNAASCTEVYKWHKKDIAKGKFTEIEKKQLIEAIKKVTGNDDLSCKNMKGVSWKTIGSYVPTRNYNQCRQYWADHLAWKTGSARKKWNHDCYCELAHILKETNVENSAMIDWYKIYKSFEDFAPSNIYVQKRWLYLRSQIADYKNKNFRDIVELLCNKYPL